MEHISLGERYRYVHTLDILLKAKQARDGLIMTASTHVHEKFPIQVSSSNPSLASLGNFYTNPSNSIIPCRQFYLLCRGNRLPATKSIFNACILHFATRLFKKISNLVVLDGAACDEDIASASDVSTEHRPNVAKNTFPSRLPTKYSILPDKDFNGEGEIQDFSKRNIGIASKHRPFLE